MRRRGLTSVICGSLIAKLKDPSLATDEALAADHWLERGESGKMFGVSNPATDEVMATRLDLNIHAA